MKLGILPHTLNPKAQEAKASNLCELQDSPSYVERPFLKNETKKAHKLK